MSLFDSLDSIERWRVTDENPPREGVDGMDFERCAALHNAILSHGWVASGRPAHDFPRTTWWQAQITDENVDAVTERLHPSVVEFLKRVWDVPQGMHFFYYLPGLNSAGGMLEDWLGHFDEGESVTLYVADQSMASKTLGLLYEQDSHIAALSLDMADYKPEATCWQTLESILTFYVDMILSRKILALHKDVLDPDHYGAVDNPDKPGEKLWRPNREIPGAMLTDPATGVAKPRVWDTEPWVAVPSTTQDLEDTLATWEALVEAIHTRMPSSPSSAQSTYGLATQEVLTTYPSGFAKSFLTRAQKPNFTHIAPGLRLLSPSELVFPPTYPPLPENTFPPILLFRGPGTATLSSQPWAYNYGPIPAGLYLSPHDPSSNNPFEDGARLVLPYNIGAYEDRTRGRWGDGSEMEPSNDGVYQQGWNPFVAPHDVQVKGVFGVWLECVEEGFWRVGREGVEGGIRKFGEAVSEEYWQRYTVGVGMGGTV